MRDLPDSTPCENGEPIYVNDIIATQNRIDIKVHQITMVGTYGLSDKLDVSIAIPIVDVRVGMTSMPPSITSSQARPNHTFAPITDNPRETYIDQFNAILTNSVRQQALVICGSAANTSPGVIPRKSRQSPSAWTFACPPGTLQLSGFRHLGFAAIRNLLVFRQSFSARECRL